MICFPNELPEITLHQVKQKGSVTCKQVLGSFVELKLGEKVRYGEYEGLEGKELINVHEEIVTRRMRIHGIDCFEVEGTYTNFRDKKKHRVVSYNREIDGHIQALAYLEEYADGITDFYSFKDQHFMEHWAEGVNNAGREIKLESKGHIQCIEGKLVVDNDKNGVHDVVGEYILEISGREFNTIRFVLIAGENQASDFFIGMDGREVLHRFFIPDYGFNEEMKDNPYSRQYPQALIQGINDRNCICTTYAIPEYAL
jgi:hypothetical protein